MSPFEENYETLPTKLSQMQDIGGCRAVMLDNRNAKELFELFISDTSSHMLANSKNYVLHPIPNGYRSYHLVYRYNSTYQDLAPWDRLRIEIQIRSTLQHAWATTVETVGMMTNQDLKGGNGSRDWATVLCTYQCRHSTVGED